MTIQFRAIKKLGALRGATPEDAEALALLPEGQPIKLEATIRTRSSRHHRWFFGLLGVVAEQTGGNTDQLLHMVKIGIGHFDPIIMPKTGEVVYMPRSVSFARMDQQQFNDFADRAVTWILDNIMDGVTDADLRREVSERTGVWLDTRSEPGAPGRHSEGGGEGSGASLPSEATNLRSARV